jgi:hypothetical protein
VYVGLRQTKAEKQRTELCNYYTSNLNQILNIRWLSYLRCLLINTFEAPIQFEVISKQTARAQWLHSSLCDEFYLHDAAMVYIHTACFNALRYEVNLHKLFCWLGSINHQSSSQHLYKAGFTLDVGHARCLTPIFPIYWLLVLRPGRESSCRIHGSREHGARTERRGRVANGCFTARLPVHD